MVVVVDVDGHAMRPEMEELLARRRRSGSFFQPPALGLGRELSRSGAASSAQLARAQPNSLPTLLANGELDRLGPLTCGRLSKHRPVRTAGHLLLGLSSTLLLIVTLFHHCRFVFPVHLI